MKTIKSLFLVGILSIAAALPLRAQKAGVYHLLSGGTTILPAQTTNTVISGVYSTNAGQSYVTNQYGAVAAITITPSNLTMTVSEFNDVGFTFLATPSLGNTNGQYGVRIYRSWNNAVTFEATPYVSFTNVTAGTASIGATYQAATNLPNLSGATHIGFSFENNGAAGGCLTNVGLDVYLKSVKYGAKQATQ
jgi:hypothetical protein